MTSYSDYSLGKLHFQLAYKTALELAHAAPIDPLRTWVGAPASGKSTFLGLVADQASAIELACIHGSVPKLKAALEEASERAKQGEKVLVIIDNIDRGFGDATERALRNVIASNSRTDQLVRIVATQSDQPDRKVRLGDEEKPNPPDQTLNAFEASRAMNSFVHAPLIPDIKEYRLYLERFLAPLFLAPSHEGEGEKLSHMVVESLLQFMGPYPPFFQPTAHHIRSSDSSVDAFKSGSRGGDHFLMASQILVAVPEDIIIRTLNWLLMRSPKSRPLLNAVSEGRFDDLSEFEQMRILGYLASAGMAWQEHGAGLPPMMMIAINNVIDRLAQPPAVNQIPVALSVATTPVPAAPSAPEPIKAGYRVSLRDRAIFVEHGSGGSPIVVAFSGREWQVLNALSSEEIRPTSQIAKLVGMKESDARAAINRIIIKLTNARVPWVVFNVMRRGYLMRMSTI